MLGLLRSPRFRGVYQQVAVRPDLTVEQLPVLEMHGYVGGPVMGVKAIEACFERMNEGFPRWSAVFMVQGRVE